MAAHVEPRPHERVVVADLDIEIHALHPVGGRRVVLEVDGLRLWFSHRRILTADPRPPDLDAPDARAEAFLRRLEIEAHLQVQPELRRGPEVAREAQRRIGGDAAQAAHDLVDAARRHLDVDRQAVLRYAEAVEEIALQYFARMQRALRHDYARSPILTRTVNTWLCIARPSRPNAVRLSRAAARLQRQSRGGMRFANACRDADPTRSAKQPCIRKPLTASPSSR